jgi:hypothetical protein
MKFRLFQKQFLSILVCLAIFSPPPSFAETPDSLSVEVTKQLSPPSPNASLKAAREKIVAERTKLIEARKAREGVAPHQAIDNEIGIAVESHSGFFKDWYWQSRYFYPTAAIVAVEGAGVFSYWLYLRKLKLQWLPRLEAIESLSAALKPQMLAFTEAEDAFRSSLLKNWADLGEEGRAALKSTLDPSFLDRLKGDLSRLESFALTAAEQDALRKAGSVEVAFHKLALATRELISEIQANIPLIERTINEKSFPYGSKQAPEALNLHQQFARDLRAIEQLDATLNRPGSFDLVLRAKHLQVNSFPKLGQFIESSLTSLDSVDSAAGNSVRESMADLRTEIERLKRASPGDRGLMSIHSRMEALQSEVSKTTAQESQRRGSIESTKLSFQKLEVAMADFTQKETHLRSLLRGQIDSVPWSERSFSRVGLAPKFIDAELAAMRAEAGTPVVVTKEVVEAAEKALVKAGNNLSSAVSAAADGSNLRNVGVYAGQVQLKEATQLKRELRGLSDALKLSKSVEAAQHSFIRQTIHGLEANAAAFRTEAEARLASTKNLRPSWKLWKGRSWIPNLGVVALIGIPALDYLSRRSAGLRADSHSVMIHTARMLSERGASQQDLENYAGQRLQYGAFFQAWKEHLQLGKAGIAWPFSEPGPSNSTLAHTEDLNPDLLTIFIPCLDLATEELNAELDAEVGQSGKASLLSYDERLYRKMWTSLIDYARQNPANARLQVMRWENKGASGDSRKPGEAAAEDVEDLIQDLAFTVAQAPMTPIQIREVVREVEKAAEGTPPAEPETGENSLLDPISPAPEMMSFDFPTLEALPGEAIEVPLGEIPAGEVVMPTEGVVPENTPPKVQTDGKPSTDPLPFRGPRTEPPSKPKSP